MRQAAVGERLAREELPQRQPAPVERVRGARHVDAPYAKLLFAHFRARHVRVAFEALDPVPERLRVMLAQRLRIDDLESRVRHAADDTRHVRQFAAREHVFLDEVADAAAQLRGAKLVVRDPMVQHEPAGLENPMDFAEVAAKVAHAHMLEHADAGDLVVQRGRGQVEIVPKLDADAFLQTGLLDPGRDEIVLILRQRDAGRLDAVMLRRPEDQATPAAADVEHPLAGRETKLAADVIELLLLRLVERVAFGAEVRT